MRHGGQATFAGAPMPAALPTQAADRFQADGDAHAVQVATPKLPPFFAFDAFVSAVTTELPLVLAPVKVAEDAWASPPDASSAYFANQPGDLLQAFPAGTGVDDSKGTFQIYECITPPLLEPEGQVLERNRGLLCVHRLILEVDFVLCTAVGLDDDESPLKNTHRFADTITITYDGTIGNSAHVLGAAGETMKGVGFDSGSCPNLLARMTRHNGGSGTGCTSENLLIQPGA